MSHRTYNQAGFEAVAAVAVVLIAAVIGFAGYTVMNMNKSADTEQSAASSQPAVPDKIETKADLTQTGKALDTTSSQLDSSLNDGSLDSDLNAML
jgi:uncharacterized protein HemX